MSDEKNTLLNNPEGSEDDLVELIDENGEKTLFEHLATLEFNGENYLALCDPDSDDEDLEVFILKIEQDENGEDVYTVPDDETADAVFNHLLELSDSMDGES